MDTRACCSHLDKKREDVHFDVLLKCWDLPQIPEHLAGHCGSHSDLLIMLSQQQSFHELIRQCQELVDALFSKQQDVVRVACCDSHGIHRSYAMATLLQGICEAKKCEAKKKKYNTQGPHHLDAAPWAATICTTCELCRPSDEKYLMYTRKVVYW